MLGCNQNITVWIRKKVTGTNKTNKEVFTRYVLPVKCKWKNYSERVVGNGMANIYNNVVIIVPYFESENETDFDVFDIKEGDIAALGVYDIDITGVSPFTVSEVKQSFAPSVTTINAVAYNFDDGIGMKGKHLRITGN